MDSFLLFESKVVKRPKLSQIWGELIFKKLKSWVKSSKWPSNGEVTIKQQSAGVVVSDLDFYSNDPSLNPAVFSVNICVKK